ncbi:MAG: hypothetical protein PF450_03675 [Bacteroidales bacterium]|jgi:hypothetical protein|nr:hypothetical protein [Bacteroidales bacterium]
MKKQILLLFALFMLCFVNKGFAQTEVKINHDGTNGLAIEADGTIRADGDATIWEDLRVPLSSAKKKDATKYTWITGLSGPKVDWFSDSDDNEMYFVAQLPHTYKEGTDIYAHIHWIGKSNKTGATRPRFGLEYAWVNLGETISGYTSIHGNLVKPTSTTDIVALTHYITPFDENVELDTGGIDGSGKKISSMLVCRVFRDTGDTGDNYTDDVGLLEIDFHFEVNTMGSRMEYSKDNLPAE